MKTKILITTFIFFFINECFTQTISVIGNTSPSGSWSVDTNMSTTDNITYVLYNAVLTTATGPTTGLKFRQDGAWTTNWGGTTFPNGTGALNGANIQTIAGTYDITFNRITGAYTFVQTTGFTSIGIWGPAVDSANGYAGPDVDMITSDGINYTLANFIFTSGNAYFRQDNNSTIVYGSTSFPSGTAVLSAPALTIPGGEWYVTFNRITGVYNFTYPSVGILGTALPNGFGGPDIDLSTSDGLTYTISGLVLTDGFVKFRKNNSWDINWGSTTFPSGVGTQNGQDIPVTAGTYNIIFDKTTGNYTFNNALNVAENLKLSIKVYPNPSANNWNFIATENIERIELIDITGKVVFISNPKAKESNIENTSLLNGFYFARITTPDGTNTIKLIKN